MKQSYRALILVLFLLAVQVARGQQLQPEPQKPAIPNFVEVSPLIATGGQPSDAGLKELADKGYKIIINLRTSGEGVDLAGEERQAAQLGMRYYLVPLAGKEPSEEQALAFDALMSALKNNKVFVHCGSGNRAGSLMMVYFALEGRLPLDKAEQEGRKAGLRSADLLEFAKQVIAHQKK